VREATFNALHSLDALEGATVLDLFAGSGALGIEALSRGAAHATFIDSDRRAVRAIEANLHATGLAERATVNAVDAERFLDRSRASDERWDLALLDPPYAYEGWDALLARLPAAVAVVESDRAIEAPSGWGVVGQRRYGSTLVTVLRSTSSIGPVTAPSPPE